MNDVSIEVRDTRTRAINPRTVKPEHRYFAVARTEEGTCEGAYAPSPAKAKACLTDAAFRVASDDRFPFAVHYGNGDLIVAYRNDALNFILSSSNGSGIVCGSFEGLISDIKALAENKGGITAIASKGSLSSLRRLLGLQ